MPIKMSDNQENLSPEEMRQRGVEARKSKISKEYERKLFVVQHKNQIIAWLKMAAMILVIIGVIAGLTTIIVRLVGYFSERFGNGEKVEQVEVIDNTEKPPADFAIKMTEIKLLQPVEGETTYDVMARIVNENSDWGVSKLSYTFVLKDRFDQVVAEQKRSSYILPSQSKHLIEVGIEAEKAAQTVELKIKMEQIQKLKKFSSPNIKIVDKNYQIVDQKSRVWGELHNDSPYDFSEVEVSVVLYDEAGEIVGLNFTNINAFTADSKRSFIAGWNEQISDTVAQIYIEPQLNVYGSGIFMNNYGTGQSLDY